MKSVAVAGPIVKRTFKLYADQSVQGEVDELVEKVYSAGWHKISLSPGGGGYPSQAVASCSITNERRFATSKKGMPFALAGLLRKIETCQKAVQS